MCSPSECVYIFTRIQCVVQKNAFTSSHESEVLNSCWCEKVCELIRILPLNLVGNMMFGSLFRLYIQKKKFKKVINHYYWGSYYLFMIWYRENTFDNSALFNFLVQYSAIHRIESTDQYCCCCCKQRSCGVYYLGKFLRSLPSDLHYLSFT